MLNPKLPKYMTQEEVKKFFDQVKDKRDRALFALIYHYGLRVSEACRLQLNNLDLQRNKLFIQRTKGSISGEKPLWRDTKKVLKSYIKQRIPKGQAFFTGREGPMKKRRIEQLFKYYLIKAKLNNGFTVHSLRHSIAVHILDAGQSIEYVQDHLGHKNIQNTQIYARISNPRRQEIFNQLEYHPAVVRF